MICSMTGFGRAEIQENGKKIAVEIRSVNHRFFECTIRAPRFLWPFESEFRSLLKEYALRGKIDVYIAFEDTSAVAAPVRLQEGLVEQLLAHGRTLEEKYALPNDWSISRILSFPEVLQTEEDDRDETEHKQLVETVLRQAATRLRDARAAEGERLREDLLVKSQQLEETIEEIRALEPELLTAYQNKLQAKTTELLSDAQIEESRIAAEVVLYADKICTDEETIRLHSHIRELRDTLQEGTGIGRKLDFLAQEMNREANTILSKAGDMATSHLGVSLKTGIEKIREQIQNIE